MPPPSAASTPRSETTSVRTLGVAGLGTMGLRIAGALAATHGVGALRVHDVAAAATGRAADAGLSLVDDVGDLTSSDVVVLSLPTPAVVLEVVGHVAERAAAEGCRPVVLDTSTIDPGSARAAAARLETVGVTYADCPVLGRPESVGRWTVPVGGSEEVVALAREVLAPVASSVVGVGDTGAAATAKVLNNLMLGTINAVTAELLLLAEAAGLDPGAWVDLVVDSGAASVSPLFRDVAARAVDDDFAPTFSVRLMQKDNALALALADGLGVPLDVGRAAQALNDAALDAGHGDEDSIAVLKFLEARTGLRARRHA